MVSKKVRKLKLMMLSLLAFLVMTPIVAKAEEPNKTTPQKGIGNISIILNDTEDNAPKGDVELGIIKVADEDEGLYYLVEPFSDSKIDLNTIETTAELDSTAKQFVEMVKEPDMKVKTSPAGTCVVKGLEAGVYLIYPIDLASYDHITPVIVAIPTFNEDSGEMMYNLSIEPKHHPVLTNIQVRKVDANNEEKVLKSASFTLFDKDHNEIITLNTDDNGICSFEGYRRGTYYLKETKAPQGYRLSDEEIKVIIDENYDENHIYQISVSNELLPVIGTGDNLNMMPMAVTLCLSGLGLISLGIANSMKKKKRNEAK